MSHRPIDKRSTAGVTLVFRGDRRDDVFHREEWG